ncbi:MAG: hypothetical protein PHX51_02790 [Clostridia bacterium]|nr:hypothetical protein [Clostridia bacterium]
MSAKKGKKKTPYIPKNQQSSKAFNEANPRPIDAEAQTDLDEVEILEDNEINSAQAEAVDGVDEIKETDSNFDYAQAEAFDEVEAVEESDSNMNNTQAESEDLAGINVLSSSEPDSTRADKFKESGEDNFTRRNYEEGRRFENASEPKYERVAPQSVKRGYNPREDERANDSMTLVAFDHVFEEKASGDWDVNDKTGVVEGNVNYPNRLRRLNESAKNRYNFLKNTIMRYEGTKDLFFKECELYEIYGVPVMVLDIVDGNIRIFSRLVSTAFPPSPLLTENTFSRVLPFKSAVIVKNDKHLNYAVRFITRTMEKANGRTKRMYTKVDYFKRLLNRGILPTQLP